MDAEGLILYYNRLNGNPIAVSKLKSFLLRVQNFLDGDGHGPLVNEVRGIHSRLTKELKRAKRYDVIGRVNLTPIKLTKAKKEMPVWEKHKKTIAKADKKMPRTIRDVMSVAGLQEIVSDSDFNEGKLNGINDTAYQVITDRILEIIKGGGLMWRKPWNEKVSYETDFAHNYVTKHVYRSGNSYLNWLRFGFDIMLKDGKKKWVQYDSPYFFSFKQVKDLGGSVKEGEAAWPVVYFKWLYRDNAKNKLIPKEAALDERGRLKPGIEKVPGIFYYNVFNYQQCTGLDIAISKRKPRSGAERIEAAEKIIASMPNRPTMKYEGQDAWYNRRIDTVQVPKIEHFKKEQFFYGVQFHELIHATGHEKRVYRELEATRRFGDKNYAFEELIAELGSSFLCGESGILYYTMKNSAAYIKSWSGRLAQEMAADPKFFFRAASKAQQAADYIIGEKKIAKAVKEKKVEEAPKLKRASKSPRPPVERVEHSKAAPEPQRKSVSMAGFVTADKGPETPANTFTLPGEIGKFLQRLQAFKLAIVIAGETHSSKSQIGMQIADAFAEAGHDVGWLDWEQGGLESKETTDNKNRNVKPENRKRISISGDFPRTIEAVKGLAKKFKVIALDSGSKLNEISNAWIDQLREESPDTIWIIMMQQNAKGTTRGGSSAEFDSPVVMMTYRPDESDYSKNYAYLFKNRGNNTGLYYMISKKKIVHQNPEVKKVEAQVSRSNLKAA